MMDWSYSRQDVWIYRGDVRSDLGGGGSRSVVSVTSANSGKRYAEVVFASLSNSAPDNNCIGITPISGATVSPRVGGVGLQKNGQIFVLDVEAHADGPVSIQGDVINLAVDCSNGKVWIGKNGAWYASGNPAAGTGATATLAVATYYVGAATGNNPGGAGAAFDLRTQSSQFTGTIPSGFSAWYP